MLIRRKGSLRHRPHSLWLFKVYLLVYVGVGGHVDQMIVSSYLSLLIR